MLQQTLAILLVLALLASTLYVVKRKGWTQLPGGVKTSGGRSKEMAYLERLPLGPQHSLHLVQVRDRILVISQAPSGCSRVASFKC